MSTADITSVPAAYVAAVSHALLQIKRSDPIAMIAAASETIAFSYRFGVNPTDTAHQILDDAMTGNGTL